MFCQKCGASIAEGSKFCSGCGWAMPAEVPVPIDDYPAARSSDDRQEREKKKGGFWSSGVGIALVVIIGVAVIAGITLGLVFLLRSGADREVDAETVKVWDEYESILEDSSENIPQITLDQTALAKSREDLKKTQEKVAALEKVLEKTGGTKARRTTGRSSNNQRDIKADQMAAALAAYTLYIQKMNELFTTLIGANLLDQTIVTKLNEILAELQKLGANVKVTADKFLQNNTRVVTVKIDPPILKFAAKAAVDLQQNVNAVQQAEMERIAAEQAAAEAAAAAAAAEAERQRQEQQPRGRWVRVARVANPCGDSSCDICYESVWVEN